MIPGNANPLLLASAADAAAAGVATKSLRFNDDDSAYLNRTPSSASNRKTWSWSAWVKRSALGTNQKLFSAGTSSNYFALAFNTSDQIQVDSFGTGANAFYMHTGDMVFRDVSAWYSVVAVLDTTESTGSDRFKLYINGSQVTLTVGTNVPPSNADQLVNSTNEHKIGNIVYGTTSQYFDGYLADIYFIDGSALDATSFGAYDDNGVWQAAAYSGTFGTNGFHLNFSDASSAAALGTDSSGNSNTFTVNNFTHAAGVLVSGGKSEAVSFDGVDDSLNYSNDSDLEPSNGNFTLECFVYRHTGQISVYYGQNAGNMGIRVKSNGGLSVERRAVAFDLTGTAGDVPDNQWSHIAVTRHAGTMRTYVNGVHKSSVSNTQTYTGTFSSGKTPDAFDEGAVASLHFVKGTALYTGTSSFTPPTTISSHANTKLLCCQSASSATAATVKPSGVTISTSGSPTAGPFPQTEGKDVDVLFDVPTNGTQSDTGAGGEVSGNYCTLNPLLSGSTHTLSNGNLDVSMSGSSQHTTAGTIGVSSGKWYWEMTVNALSSTYYPGVGIDTNPVGSVQSGSTATGLMYLKSGAKFTSGNLAAYGASYDVGDVIGVALDMDGGTLTFYKNGSSQGQAFSSISGTVFPVVTGTLNGTPGASFNFGQRAWAYSAPSNHKALCTTNLPTPTIADGRDHFYALASTGTFGGGTVTDSDANFTPDWVWVKRRNAAERHKLYDILRGTDGTRYKHLESDGSDAEGSGESGITAFVAGGYTSEGGGHINSDGQPFISWMWNAGTSTASNTDGTGTSSVQVRANTTAGFSIVTYTGGSSSPANSDSGDSFGHGLGAAPDLVICKKRSGANSWPVYHRAAPTGALILDSTSANDSSSFLFAKKDPTSTEVFLGNNPEINNSSHNYVAYCFAPIAGFSSFGSYEGNGSSDGPFAHTGHRIAWLMIKDATSTGAWIIWDVARQAFNAQGPYLLADASGSESDADLVDFLSNGFKIRTTAGSMNTSGETYIYAAFAENPFQANGGLAR